MTTDEPTSDNKENSTMTSIRRTLAPLVPLVAALVLAGCATTVAPLPEALPEMPSTFKEGSTAWTRDPAPAPQGSWW